MLSQFSFGRRTHRNTTTAAIKTSNAAPPTAPPTMAPVWFAVAERGSVKLALVALGAEVMEPEVVPSPPVVVGPCDGDTEPSAVPVDSELEAPVSCGVESDWETDPGCVTPGTELTDAESVGGASAPMTGL